VVLVIEKRLSSSCIILDGQLSALGSFVSPIVGPTNGT